MGRWFYLMQSLCIALSIGMVLIGFQIEVLAQDSTDLATQDAAESFKQGYVAYQQGNYEKAVSTWHQLAEKGHHWAQMLLGLMYDWGKGIPQDSAIATQWYRQAAGLTLTSGLSQEEVRRGMLGPLDLDPYKPSEKPTDLYNPFKNDDSQNRKVDELIEKYNNFPIKPDIDEDRKGFKIEVPFGGND